MFSPIAKIQPPIVIQGRIQGKKIEEVSRFGAGKEICEIEEKTESCVWRLFERLGFYQEVGVKDPFTQEVKKVYVSREKVHYLHEIREAQKESLKCKIV